MSGSATSAKRVVSWKAPSTAQGIRPVTGYRIKLNRQGCSMLIMNKKLSKATTKYTFKRSFLLKHSKCKANARGEVVAKTLHYRVRVQAINSKGTSLAASRTLVVKR
ncbi:MAG: fibronectin type III domain-containing protein [Candidatus Nanopelagicales bacterium]